MNYILYDDPQVRVEFYPLTLTRPVSELRIGMSTIREKWEDYLETSVSYLTDAYLTPKYPFVMEEENVLLSSNVLPNPALVEAVRNLKRQQVLVKDEQVLACCVHRTCQNPSEWQDKEGMEEIPFTGDFVQIDHLWDLFLRNADQIRQDFVRYTAHRKSEKLSGTNFVQSAENIFVEKGCKIEFAYLNASEGPIYIGEGVEIMEGAMLRGPLSIGAHTQIKMGAKIYGESSFGPHCKVGGEVSNSIIIGYSNKGHDGFLGNALLGEWCNLGADTNNSNLKNDYSQVRIWNYGRESFVQTGQTFCGLIMGDHSKTAINTMFNTGTVVGVAANVFGSGFPRQFIPSFTWGGVAYEVERAFPIAERVMQRRHRTFTEEDKAILTHVYEMTHSNRKKNQYN